MSKTTNKIVPEIVGSMGGKKVDVDRKPKINVSPDKIGSNDSNPNKTKFPYLLYRMLEAAESEGFTHIVSWTKNGFGCVVHDQEKFTKQIIRRFFNHSNIRSLHRQFSFWGFTRDKGSGGKNGPVGYSHPYFSRNNSKLLSSILRKNTPKGKCSKKNGVCINLRYKVSGVDKALTALGDASNEKATEASKRKWISASSGTAAATSPAAPKSNIPVGVVSINTNYEPPKKVRRVSTCNEDPGDTVRDDRAIPQDLNTNDGEASKENYDISDTERESLRFRLQAIYASLEEAEQTVLTFKKRLQHGKTVHIVSDDKFGHSEPFNIDDWFNAGDESLGMFEGLADGNHSNFKFGEQHCANIPVSGWC